ncbi:MAG: gamma-glutamyltransferase [Pseudomonadota bacterium]
MSWFTARRVALLCLLAVAAPAYAKPQGACVTAHPIATQACADVLASGGNAFDAAVAASATLAVVEPFGSGFGGGGFFLLHRAADGKNIFIDGRETAPLAAHADLYRGLDGKIDRMASITGAKAAAIPHQAALLEHTAKAYGTRPFAQLLAPAIHAAREGFAIDWRLAGEIADHAKRMNPAMQAVFTPGGVPLAKDALLKQADLAATLQRLGARGAAEFREGETAQRLLAGVAAGGGIWKPEDLLRIQITEREPLVGYFRSNRIITAPPPSAGGAAILQALSLLEAKGFESLATVEGKHQVIEALRRAFRDRNAWFGDPDFVRVPLYRLLSRSYLLPLAASIGAKATPSKDLPAPSAGQEGGQTTHFSVMDAAGNRVAGTQTLNIFFGAAFMAPGTGIVLNDEMDDFSVALDVSNAYGLAGSKANAIAPGKRPLSSMSPTFVEGPRGVLVTGTPGGSRIPSMVLLSVLRFVEGATAAEIAATKRIHHQWLPDVLNFEPDALRPDEQAALAAKGHVLKAAKEPYGNLQVIVREAATSATSVGPDPRWVASGQTVPTR